MKGQIKKFFIAKISGETFRIETVDDVWKHLKETLYIKEWSIYKKGNLSKRYPLTKAGFMQCFKKAEEINHCALLTHPDYDECIFIKRDVEWVAV
jgi:hypothetical protein